jgi:hypothetical protein
LTRLVKEIDCSNCGAPLEFEPGELIVSCRYCGYTSVIQTGEPFTLEHSMVLNTTKEEEVNELIRSWMKQSFMAPRDLERKATVSEATLVYLPFWVMSTKSTTTYKGAVERVTPVVNKEGQVNNRYSWLVIARKGVDFPTRAYKIPLEGRIPFDPTKLARTAKILNSEIEKAEAVEIAEQEIKQHQLFIAKQDVDIIIESQFEFNLEEVFYIHAPVWFVSYTYKGSEYQILLDGASKDIIKGGFPPVEFKLI